MAVKGLKGRVCVCVCVGGGGGGGRGREGGKEQADYILWIIEICAVQFFVVR